MLVLQQVGKTKTQKYTIRSCYLFPGCSHGNTCMPAGSVCPHVCHIPAPAVCAAGEVWCDNGSNHGCSLGSHCMPAGSVCPPVCHTPVPAICGDGEVSCDGGSTNGCPNLNTCHPAGLTIFTQFTLPYSFLKELFVHMSVTPQPLPYVEMEKCLVMVEVTMVVLM